MCFFIRGGGGEPWNSVIINFSIHDYFDGNAIIPTELVYLQVSFKDEPGEGSGVARSFYVAFAQAVLSSEKLSSLDGILVGGKTLQYSMCLRTLNVWLLWELNLLFKSRSNKDLRKISRMLRVNEP